MSNRSAAIHAVRYVPGRLIDEARRTALYAAEIPDVHRGPADA
jgi:hypothetical protein